MALLHKYRALHSLHLAENTYRTVTDALKTGSAL